MSIMLAERMVEEEKREEDLHTAKEMIEENALTI